MSSALFLTAKLPCPPEDGGRIAAWNLARCLRHNGYQLDLACFAGSAGEADAQREALAAVFRSVTTATREVSRQYPSDLARALLRRESYFVHKYRSALLESRIEALLKANAYDLTVVESVFSAVYLHLLRRHPSAGRVMLRLQNVEHEIFERLARHERHPLYRWLLRREAREFGRFEIEAIRSTTDVRAISERDASMLAERSGRPVGVLDAFVDSDRYRPGAAGDVEPRTIVCMGDYAWRPNQHGALWFHQHVWPPVAERFPDARWYVVGRNPTAAIRRLASERVVVTGRVEDDDAYFRRAHLFVVPLLEGSGVRIKILLALATGRPVLSTAVGAEGIHYPGLLVADRADEWIEQIERAFGAPPSVDLGAAEYVRRRHHWRRPFDAAGE